MEWGPVYSEFIIISIVFMDSKWGRGEGDFKY